MNGRSREPGGLNGRVIRFGEFELDLAEESLRRGGEPLNINHRMFQVLALLVERRGEIVSKDEFFEQVWAGSHVEENNLTVAITGLRKALGDDARHARFIENVPRKGYRFVTDIEYETKPAVAKSVAVQTSERKTNPFRLGLVFALFLLLAGAAAYSFRTFGILGAAPRTIGSVAVLPFEISDPEAEYIADGLSETLANRLRVFPGLRVTDQRAAYEYKGKTSDPIAVGRELGVAAVLTGRVDKSGDQMTVFAELTDVAGSFVIWNREFPGSTNDLLSLQKELADSLTGVVLPAASEEERARRAVRTTSDPEAFDLYIRGLHLWNKRIDSDIVRSIELFRAAIDKDPTFAKAYIALANAYSLAELSERGISNEERAKLAIATAEKALEIDDTLGEAYSARAVNKCFINWDLAGAEADYRRARALNPNDAITHHWYAELLAMHGRFDESLAMYERAMELDPLSSPIRTDYALTFYYKRDYDRAIELLNKEKNLHPNYARTYLFLSYVYPEKGMYAEAVDAMETRFDMINSAGGVTAEWYQGHKERLAKMRASLPSGIRGFWEGTRIDDQNEPYLTAVAYAKMGEKEKAFEFLERAFEIRYTGMVWLKVTPELDDLRVDPRFSDLLRRVGLEPKIE
ncbi:MAG: winged helix-turn-helix domain-containing protein [Acidobacteriota bacterium]|nr:MAG: winged helix-turn-helix domain-containing protein [Acidobacteriota bacterium]